MQIFKIFLHHKSKIGKKQALFYPLLKIVKIKGVMSNVLFPGHWIVFDITQGERKVSLGPYRIITRTDSLFDAGRCFLMNLNGEFVDYSDEKHWLGRQELPKKSCSEFYAIRELSKEEIQGVLGDQIPRLQKKAIECLKQLAISGCVPNGFFNPDNENTLLSAEEVKQKYRLS